MFYFRIRAEELRSSIDNREGGLSMDLDIGSPRQNKNTSFINIFKGLSKNDRIVYKTTPKDWPN